METLNFLLDFTAHYVLILLVFYVGFGLVVAIEKSLILATGYSFFGIYSAIKTWVFVNPTWAWSFK